MTILRGIIISGIMSIVLLLLNFHPLHGQTDSIGTTGMAGVTYGLTGGFVWSAFRGDSTGYSRTALPYGGCFIATDLTRRLGLSGSMLYTVKGANRDTPYERYRYTYITTEIAAHVRMLDFIRLEGGYQYRSAINSKLVVLNGNNPSGVERREIAGFGNHGQWVAGATFDFNPSTSLQVRYGFPGSSTPMSHLQVGVRFHLKNRSSGTARQQFEEQQRSIAIQQATLLKEGVLLVRLRSNQSVVASLEQRGLLQEASKLRKVTARENQELLDAFARYTFSKVLFFYDYHSREVREGKADSLLLDLLLQPAPAGGFRGEVFIAEFGNYESPERYYHVRRDYQYLKDHNIAPDSSAAWITYGDRGFGIGGIVVMDREFQPLQKPFPVFTPITNRTIFRSETKMQKAVLQLNEALFKLYHEGMKP